MISKFEDSRLAQNEDISFC